MIDETSWLYAEVSPLCMVRAQFIGPVVASEWEGRLVSALKTIEMGRWSEKIQRMIFMHPT